MPRVSSSEVGSGDGERLVPTSGGRDGGGEYE